MKRRIVRNLASLGGSSAIASLLALFATIANSRALSIVDFGTYVLLQASALLLAGLTSFSPQQPVIKMGMAALEGGDTRRLQGLIALGFAVDLASALTAGTLGLLVAWLLPDRLGIPAEHSTAALIVAGSLFFQGYKTSEGIFRVFNRFDLLAASIVIVAILQLGMALLLWAVGASFVWYGVLAAGVLALPPMIQLVLALRLLRKHSLSLHAGAVRTARKDMREFLRYCWVTGVTSTLDTVRMNGDATLVGLLVSVEGAGLYGVAKQLSGVVRKATVIYASVLFPELAGLAARHDRTSLVRLLRTATLAALGATGVLVLGAWLLGEIALVFLFGAPFGPAAPAMILLVAAAGLQIASSTFSMAVQAFVTPTALLRCYIVASLVFLASIWPGLLMVGLAGAGIAQILFVAALGASCALLLKSGGLTGGAGHAD